MRLTYSILMLAAFCAAAWTGPQQAYAQTGDTLLVEWESAPGSGEPVRNALRDAILNDASRPEGRVYKLRRGGFYWLTDRIANTDFNLTIVGQEAHEARPEDNVCGAGGDQDCGPAIIQRVLTEDGQDPDGTMFEATGNLALKNVWIMGQTSTGNRANYEPIKLLGTGKRYVFDRVIFDRNDWHHLGPDNPDSDFLITNCVFRNLFGPTQIWEGLGVRFEVGADTVIIENNTFLNIGFTPFQSEAAPVNYLRFNHNTLVNIGRSFQAGAIWKEAYVTNNLFVNGFFQGESPAQYNDPARTDPHTGFFGISNLPSAYGANAGRRVVLNNNLFWRDPAFDAIYSAQNIRAQPFISDTTQGWFDAYDAMVMEDNVEGVRPNLTVYPLTASILDSITVYLQMLYADPVQSPAPRWYFDPGREEDCYECSIWPLPENFAYDNASLLTAGTDGLPLGDLNWFPSQKQTFLANRAQYVDAIEGLAGGRIRIDVITEVEAENATLEGDAAVETFSGFSYFRMESGGFIEWTFDVATAGTYGLNVHTNMGTETQRGQRIKVDGVNIRNNDGFGEWYFCTAAQTGCAVPLPQDDWATVEVRSAGVVEGAAALDLQPGAHTIRIEPSWGYQNFSGVDVVDAGGNVVAELRAPDASYSLVIPNCEAADYCPSFFKSVAMGSGSLSFDLNAPGAGQYMMRVFYQTPDGPATGQLLVDGNAVAPSLAFEGEAGVLTGRDLTTAEFALTAGNHTITLDADAAGLVVDYVQVLGVNITVGVDGGVLPDGYALGRSYPNPFRAQALIPYTLGGTGHVTLEVYDLLGRKVATLVDDTLPAGDHQATFDGQALASGVYLYRLQTDVGQQVRTLVLVK